MAVETVLKFAASTEKQKHDDEAKKKQMHDVTKMQLV